MGLAVLTGNIPKILSKQQSLAVWEVLQGRQEPANDKQAEFCSKIERLYLNYEYAPQDYRDMYPEPVEQPEQELSWYQK
jgi:hypothetical protein